MKKIRVTSGFAIAFAACAVACSSAPGGDDRSSAEATPQTTDAPGLPPTSTSTSTTTTTTTTTTSAPHRIQFVAMPGAERPARDAVGKAGGGDAHMVYRGGPVIPNVELTTVFWGSNVAYQSDFDTFYASIVDSAYVDQLSEYDTPTQKIGRGRFVTSYVDQAAPSSTQLGDDQIQKELARLIEAGSLPQPGANTLFMVHFPPGVTITTQDATSCQQFCAYHSSFDHQNGAVYYGVIPDFGGACSSCDSTVIASHEVSEAITDPNIGVANTAQDEHQLGWYDDVNDEIADVCENGSYGTFAGYRVAKVWSNQANACVSPSSGDSR